MTVACDMLQDPVQPVGEAAVEPCWGQQLFQARLRGRQEMWAPARARATCTNHREQPDAERLLTQESAWLQWGHLRNKICEVRTRGPESSPDGSSALRVLQGANAAELLGNTSVCTSVRINWLETRNTRAVCAALHPLCFFEPYTLSCQLRAVILSY